MTRILHPITTGHIAAQNRQLPLVNRLAVTVETLLCIPLNLNVPCGIVVKRLGGLNAHIANGAQCTHIQRRLVGKRAIGKKGFFGAPVKMDRAAKVFHGIYTQHADPANTGLVADIHLPPIAEK